MRLPRFQFRLRMLFILTLIAAIPCASVGRRIEQKRREREAVEAIRSAGGIVRYEYGDSKPAGLEWLKSLLGENVFDDVCAVTITPNTRPLPDLTLFSHVHFLALDHAAVTDSELARIKEFKELEWLWLRSGRITDAGLANLDRLPTLQRLWLIDIPVSDAGLTRLKGLKELQTLYLGNTHVTDPGVADLQKELPDCKIELPTIRPSANH